MTTATRRPLTVTLATVLTVLTVLTSWAVITPAAHAASGSAAAVTRPLPAGASKDCRPGKGRTVTKLPDISLPAVVVPDTVTTPATVDGVVIPSIVVPGYTIPALLVRAGCIVRWAAPAGCLGAVEISGASIPAITLPARTLAAVTLPNGMVLPALTTPGDSVPVTTVKPVKVNQVCAVTHGTHRLGVYRPALLRPALQRRSLLQPALSRPAACGTTGCLSYVVVPYTLVPYVLLPYRLVPYEFLPAATLKGGHVTVVKGHKDVAYVAPADVLFDFDSSSLRPGATATLQAIAADLHRKSPTGPVTVQGHTDSVGSDAYNRALSLRRAKAVADWLAAHGQVTRSRLHEQGFGERQPVAPNTTATNRQLNRRVVIVGTT